MKSDHLALAASLLVAGMGCGDAATSGPTVDGGAARPDAAASLADADGGDQDGAPESDAGAPADPGDALHAGSWACLEGARAGAGGALVIDPIDRWIVGYEPAPRTANPPIMMVGPHLEVAAGASVRIDTRLSASAATPALLTLNGKRPIIYDEWRQEGTAVAVGLEGGKLVLQVWDGRRATPTTQRFTGAFAGGVELSLVVAGATATVSVAGVELGHVTAAAPLFPDGRVYFGATVAPANRLTIEHLDVEGATVVVGHAPGAVPPQASSLRARATAHGRYIGTAVASYPLLGEPAYATTLGREFSMVTPENMMKFQFIHPARDVYNFCDADALVDFAEANGMRVHGHALVWGEAVPEWISKGHFTNAEIADILHDHITTIVSRYRGRIAEWDVLNEPLEEDTDVLRETIWKRALGDDYVATIFAWAHEADPDAKLYINEYGIESADVRADNLFDLVKSARLAGVPIHGVGFQGHEDLGEEASPSELRTNMARYQTIGVDVRISELDDNPGHRPSANELREQAAFFRAELDVCLALPHCKSFSMWGFTDKYSSLADDGAYDQIGYGLIFDESYTPKPAYDALFEGLGP